MKLIGFILILIGFSTCKKESITYSNYTVEFYVDHKELIIVEPKFETVEIKVQVKPEHRAGATFKIVEEKIISKQSYSIRVIKQKGNFNIVSNAETNSISNIDYFFFLNKKNSFIEEVEPEYTIVEKNIENSPGIGKIQPAEYISVYIEKLVIPYKLLEEKNKEREVKTYNFRIPNNYTIKNYLLDQFQQQDVVDCLEGNAFRIVD